MPKPERRDPVKEKHWRRLLRQWQRSGLTGRDFCAVHRLSEPSFYAWRREIARRDQQPPSVATPATAADAPTPLFQELTLAPLAPLPSAIEVVLAQGRLLRIGPGFDADLLRQLLRVLEGPAC
jgi:hypothetical protein